jgi:hypothetical protein
VTSLQYQSQRESCFREEQAFVQGLSFQEATLLSLNEVQTQNLVMINNEFYEAILTAYSTTVTEKKLNHKLQSLLSERNRRIEMILDNHQRYVWIDNLKKRKMNFQGN